MSRTTVHGPPVEGADKECGRCRRRTVARTRWWGATGEQRTEWKAQRVLCRDARGLCTGCYRWALNAGRLADYDRHNQRTVDVIEEWHHMADPMVPMVQEIRRLAPRLGMLEKTLEQALHRGGVRSRFESGHGERFRVA